MNVARWRCGRLACGMAVALPLLWLLAMFVLDLPHAVRMMAGNWLVVPPVTLAAVQAFRLSRLRHLEARQRSGWWWIGIAMSCDALGFVAYGWYEAVLDIDPTYNWVNLPFYAYFFAMLYGLVRLTPPSQTESERPLYALDVVAVGLSGAMVLLEFVARPLLLQDDGSSLFHIVILLLYPFLGAFTFFGVASLMMRLPQGIERRPYQVLSGAVALYLCADSAWSVLSLVGDYDTGMISDIAWLVGACLFFVATDIAWRGKRHADFVPGTYAGREFARLMPYAAVATGMAVLLIGILRTGQQLVPLAIIGALLAVAVFVRQWLAAHSDRDRALADTRELAERRLAALVSHSAEAILLLGGDLRLRYASPGAMRVFGAQVPASGAPLIDSIHPADRPRARAAFEAVLAGGRMTLDWRIAQPNQQWRTCENVLSNCLDDPAVGGVVVNVRDVSERVALEERLRHQALHDPLTGVANRALFIDRLGQALMRRERHGERVAVIFADLDHFKLVNDSLGHIAGDHLLRTIGQRLQDSVRAIDTVARFGGDEFAVLLEDIDSEQDVLDVAQRILDSLAQPQSVDARAMVVGASIGVAIARPDDTAETLMRNADLAVYKAKSGGRGRISVFGRDT